MHCFLWFEVQYNAFEGLRVDIPCDNKFWIDVDFNIGVEFKNISSHSLDKLQLLLLQALSNGRAGKVRSLRDFERNAFWLDEFSS